MREAIRNLSLIVAVLLTVLVAGAQQTVVLHNVRLIDGSGAPAREHMDIAMRDGIILQVGASIARHPGERIVNLSGKTVMPGLITAHSHLGVLENNTVNTATAFNAPNVIASLRQFERYGVTTVLSLGTNGDLIYALREQQREGNLGGATILTAGRGIGAFGPGAAPPFKLAADQIDRPTTPEEARRDVDVYATHHVDIVKVWVDSFHGKANEMSPEIYSAVINEAHKEHLHVAAHEYALEDARRLVNDGVDVLAHSIRDKPVDSAFIQSMIQHHTWYIPTLSLDEEFYIYATQPTIMQSRFFRDAAGPQLLAKFEAPDYAPSTMASPDTKQHQQDEAIGQQNLKALYDAGVLVAFGTDSGAVPGRIPGFSEHRELEDLVSAGLTPLQAITDATGQTGQLIHVLDPILNIGMISQGYSADLVVLNADPLADIRNTRKISAVYHRGRLIPNPAPQD
jgi:imidazolonepropionase-like amidohydrolase